jgi:hypothetical protein
MTLLQSTRALLDRARARNVSLYQIAAGSAGKISYEWLKKFAAGKIPNPGVTTVENLRDELTKMAKIK